MYWVRSNSVCCMFDVLRINITTKDMRLFPPLVYAQQQQQQTLTHGVYFFGDTINMKTKIG